MSLSRASHSSAIVAVPVMPTPPLIGGQPFSAAPLTESLGLGCDAGYFQRVRRTKAQEDPHTSTSFTNYAAAVASVATVVSRQPLLRLHPTEILLC